MLLCEHVVLAPMMPMQCIHPDMSLRHVSSNLSPLSPEIRAAETDRFAAAAKGDGLYAQSAETQSGVNGDAPDDWKRVGSRLHPPSRVTAAAKPSLTTAFQNPASSAAMPAAATAMPAAAVVTTAAAIDEATMVPVASTPAVVPAAVPAAVIIIIERGIVVAGIAGLRRTRGHQKSDTDQEW